MGASAAAVDDILEGQKEVVDRTGGKEQRPRRPLARVVPQETVEDLAVEGNGGVQRLAARRISVFIERLVLKLVLPEPAGDPAPSQAAEEIKVGTADPAVRGPGGELIHQTV